MGEVALARVDVGYRLWPSLRMWQRQIDRVSSADMAREHQCGQYGQIEAGIVEIYGRGMLAFCFGLLSEGAVSLLLRWVVRAILLSLKLPHTI